MPATDKLEPTPAGPPDADRIAALEAELSAVRRELTHRVAVRTKELRTANEKLYQEILDHRKSGQTLRATEQKYRGFFEHAVEGAYQSTPEGTYLSINPALAHLYGYASAAEMQAAVANIAEDIYVDPTMRQRFK
jgi:PAS domain-containing protein